jgi:hypothetical protein
MGPDLFPDHTVEFFPHHGLVRFVWTVTTGEPPARGGRLVDDAEGGVGWEDTWLTDISTDVSMGSYHPW